MLPTWKWHLRAIVTPFGTSRRKSTGKARLRVLMADAVRAEPTAAQAKAYAYLVEHQEAIRDALLRAAMKEFNKFLGEHVDELNDELFCQAYGRFPKRVSQPELPRSQIKLSSIYLHAADKSGVAYVGYSFDCDWEDEHGLGMLTHRRQVLVAGHADVSWSSDAYESPPPAVRAKPAAKKPRRKPPLIPERLVFEAVTGDLARVEKLLAEGADPAERYGGPTSFNAIERAAMQGHAAVLRLLLEHAAQPVDVMPIGSWVDQQVGIREILAEFGVRERG